MGCHTSQDRQLAKRLRKQQMASRSQVVKDELADTVDNTDGMVDGYGNTTPVPITDSQPPEFADDDDTQEMVNIGMDESEFAGVNTDDARDERTRAALDPPQGNWLKSDKFEFSFEFRTEDRMPGDIKPNGRTILKFSGNPDARTVNGVEYAPRFFITMSPDYRASDREPQKPDLTHQLFLRAKDLFISVKQRKHKDIAELCQFLRMEEYVVRAAKGDDNLYVVGLKSKDSLRGKSRDSLYSK
jgi:hypothetical protein